MLRSALMDTTGTIPTLARPMDITARRGLRVAYLSERGRGTTMDMAAITGIVAAIMDIRFMDIRAMVMDIQATVTDTRAMLDGQCPIAAVTTERAEPDLPVGVSTRMWLTEVSMAAA